MIKAKKSLEMFQQFFNSEKAGGLILIACTIVSLLIANSSLGEAFVHFWHTSLPLRIGQITIPFNIEEWINDGLMTIFFLMVVWKSSGNYISVNCRLSKMRFYRQWPL